MRRHFQILNDFASVLLRIEPRLVHTLATHYHWAVFSTPIEIFAVAVLHPSVPPLRDTGTCPQRCIWKGSVAFFVSNSTELEITYMMVSFFCQLDWIEEHLGIVGHASGCVFEAVSRGLTEKSLWMHVGNTVPCAGVLSGIKRESRRKGRWAGLSPFSASWTVLWTQTLLPQVSCMRMGCEPLNCEPQTPFLPEVAFCRLFGHSSDNSN